MGLKGKGRLRKYYEYNSVEIRPRWDWKIWNTIPYPLPKWLKSDQSGIESHTCHLASLTISSVEIRPRWDWKIPAGGALTLKRSGWNQTKVGLKGCFAQERNVVISSWCVEIRPRWDWKWFVQGGIMIVVDEVEIRPRWDWKFLTRNPGSSPNTELKSDQGGIESLYHLRCYLSRYLVEIRPRWDWKPVKRPEQPWLRFLLKSDQGGIERSKSVLCLGFRLSSWNQTKVGLKAGFSDGNCGCNDFVEIRPRWDWK